jgi:hypothetical protein
LSVLQNRSTNILSKARPLTIPTDRNLVVLQ